jgi:hypothetical protein
MHPWLDTHRAEKGDHRAAVDLLPAAWGVSAAYYGRREAREVRAREKKLEGASEPQFIYIINKS